MSASSCAVVAVLFAAGASGVHAQGLADTAQRAASARAGKPLVRLTDKDLPALDRFEVELRQFLLTEDGLWKYVRTRRLLLDVRIQNRAFDKALLNVERDGGDALAAEAVITGDARALSMLDFERMPAREYVLSETAFRRALVDASLSDEEILRLPPGRAANAAYVRQHDRDIKSMTEYQWRQKEEHLEWMRKVRQ